MSTACHESKEAGAWGRGQGQLPVGKQPRVWPGREATKVGGSVRGKDAEAGDAVPRETARGDCAERGGAPHTHRAEACEEDSGTPCGGGAGGGRRSSAALRSREILVKPGQGLAISSDQHSMETLLSIRRKEGRWIGR